jgi:hypothetical protein
VSSAIIAETGGSKGLLFARCRGAKKRHRGKLLAIVAIYRMPESSGMEFAMASPGTSTLVDRHSKRLLVDIAEWRDRLEQLAEMRRAAAVSAPSEGAIADLKPRAPQAPA